MIAFRPRLVSLVVPDRAHEIRGIDAQVGHRQHHDDLVREGLQPREPPESDDDEYGRRR